MTDPVTNVEIEDVLSSIRRLVSDDARVIKPQSAAVKQPDRLVLTPALRVSGEDVDTGPILSEVETISPAPEVVEAVESQEDESAPILLTDLAPLVEEATPDPEGAENTDDFAQSDIDDVSFEHAADVIEAVETSVRDETEDTDVPEPGGEDELIFSQDARLEEPETADLEKRVEAETDGVEDLTSHLLSQLVEDEVEKALDEFDAAADLDTESQNRADVDDPINDDGEDGDEQDEAIETLVQNDDVVIAPTEDEIGGEPVGEESLESKIAALEELIGRGHEEEWEPEQSDPEAPVFQRSSDVLEWQDHLPNTSETADETIVVSETADQPISETADTDETEAVAGAGDALTIDEDTLRGLVSEIVRQELQGALGERITRNVRKLVRREIHRVLMSQDFD